MRQRARIAAFLLQTKNCKLQTIFYRRTAPSQKPQHGDDTNPDTAATAVEDDVVPGRGPAAGKLLDILINSGDTDTGEEDPLLPLPSGLKQRKTAHHQAQRAILRQMSQPPDMTVTQIRCQPRPLQMRQRKSQHTPALRMRHRPRLQRMPPDHRNNSGDKQKTKKNKPFMFH